MLDENNRPSLSPYIVITVGILAVSTSSVFIRFAQSEASSIVIAAYRLAIAALLLTPFALMRHRDELKTLTRKDALLGLSSGVFLAIHFATWISSLEYTSVVSSVVFVQTSPLWVALFAPIFLKEPLTKRILWGLALAFTGGIIVSIGDNCGFSTKGLECLVSGRVFGDQATYGNFLALVGAWSSAGYLIIGRNLRARFSVVSYIFIVYAVAAITLVAMMLFSGHPVSGYTSQTYIWFILLALVPQLLGHSSFNWALGYLPASFVSITLLGEPIGSAILAAFLLNEIPSVVKLIGAIFILTGIYIASIKNNQKQDTHMAEVRTTDRSIDG